MSSTREDMLKRVASMVGPFWVVSLCWLVRGKCVLVGVLVVCSVLVVECKIMAPFESCELGRLEVTFFAILGSGPAG